MRSDDVFDKELEAALDRGDLRWAMQALAARYWGRLRRLLARRCGQSVDDIVQTVFEQACRDILSFQRKGSIKKWLFGIAYHRAMDHLRAQASSKTDIFDEDTGSVDEPYSARRIPASSNPWPDVDEVMDEPARAQLLSHLLATLDPEVNMAIALRYMEGFTYPEMADICGEKPATLQARVARGLAELQKRSKTLDACPGAPRSEVRSTGLHHDRLGRAV